MKKLFALAGLLMIFVFAGSIAAQNNQMGGQGNPAQRMENQLKTLTEKLSLTADQTAKIKDLLTKNMDEMAKLREKMADQDRSAMRDAMMKNREELNKKIATLLNDKQKEEFVKLQKEQAAQRANRPAPGN